MQRLPYGQETSRLLTVKRLSTQRMRLLVKGLLSLPESTQEQDHNSRHSLKNTFKFVELEKPRSPRDSIYLQGMLSMLLVLNTMKSIKQLLREHYSLHTLKFWLWPEKMAFEPLVCLPLTLSGEDTLLMKGLIWLFELSENFWRSITKTLI